MCKTKIYRHPQARASMLAPKRRSCCKRWKQINEQARAKKKENCREIQTEKYTYSTIFTHTRTVCRVLLFGKYLVQFSTGCSRSHRTVAMILFDGNVFSFDLNLPGIRWVLSSAVCGYGNRAFRMFCQLYDRAIDYFVVEYTDYIQSTFKWFYFILPMYTTGFLGV